MHPRRLAAPKSIILLSVLVLLGTSVLVGTALRLGRAADPSVAPIWSDEFDGPKGSAPDPSKWWNDVGGQGWGNNELQYYTAGTGNAALDGAGHLVITARSDDSGTYDCDYGPCEYTSGRLLTQWKFSHQYGRFEARIRVPEGKGLLPAFWLLGEDASENPWPNSGEIDVMEILGDDPGTVKGSMHGPGYSGSQALSFGHGLPDGESFADDFHTYAVEWNPQGITWLVDGKAYGTAGPEAIGGHTWVGDKPYFILLNLAVGGDWPGSPDASTPFPADMVVDYVRVYE